LYCEYSLSGIKFKKRETGTSKQKFAIVGRHQIKLGKSKEELHKIIASI